MRDLAEQYGIEVGKTYKAKQCPFSKARTTYPRTVVSISDSGNMVEYTSGNPRLKSKTYARTSCRSFADWAGLSNRTQTVPHETPKPTVADLPNYRTYCVNCGCEATKNNGQRICDCPNGIGTDKVRIPQSVHMMKGNLVTLIRRHEELLAFLNADPTVPPHLRETRGRNFLLAEKENDRVVWLMADTRRRMAQQMAHMQIPNTQDLEADGAALKQAIPAPHLSPMKILKNSEYGNMGEQKMPEIEVYPNGHLWNPEDAAEFYAHAVKEMSARAQRHSPEYQRGAREALSGVEANRLDLNLRSIGRMMGLTERMAVAMWKAEAERAGGTKGTIENRTLTNFMNESKDSQMKWRSLATAALAAIRESGLTLTADPRVENPNELDQGPSTP
ncbi:hypothetical protein LOKG_00002 [Loktanella phage pCB2051-A]|uniref:Uncharacterized protein n=1 Tax=Loktanella phage pCB2051-A TaxID=754044 RepID=M4QSW4_9CAUD|nr:hypothetical protein LOKG_00002 [Loktanella phage pCB2051-A]AGH31439.1 hypothetical protein LOKG_00002 [Loktanella phage pCB2051-A]